MVRFGRNDRSFDIGVNFLSKYNLDNFKRRIYRSEACSFVNVVNSSLL